MLEQEIRSVPVAEVISEAVRRAIATTPMTPEQREELIAAAHQLARSPLTVGDILDALDTPAAPERKQHERHPRS